MDIGHFLSWAQSQPWSFAVPFAVAVLADWALGSFEAYKAGEFKKERVFDWIQTTVGWKKAAAVVGSVATAYFLDGKDAAQLALVGLIVVNGPAFLVVMADVKDKIVALPGVLSAKAAAK